MTATAERAQPQPTSQKPKATATAKPVPVLVVNNPVPVVADVAKPKPDLKIVKPAAPALTIIDAFNDVTLFGKFFVGESWDGWRAVLKALFALPMNETELAFFRGVAGRDPPTERARELWAIAGRRSGKDSVVSAIV